MSKTTLTPAISSPAANCAAAELEGRYRVISKPNERNTFLTTSFILLIILIPILIFHENLKANDG
jgi:hypothetical protein